MAELDAELRAIFSSECEEYLEDMAAGMLELESGQEEAGLLDRIFRSAHSLKGSSRVMGMEDLAQASHSLEDILDRLRDKSLKPSSALFEAVSQSLGGLRQLLHLSLDGRSDPALKDRIVAGLRPILNPEFVPNPAPAASSEAFMPSPSKADPSQAGPDLEEPHSIELLPAEALPLQTPILPLPSFKKDSPKPPSESPTIPPSPASSRSTDVLKVPVARLDELIRQVGELLATHQRLQWFAQDLDGLRDQLEDVLRRLPPSPLRPGLVQAAASAAQLAQGLLEEESRLERLFQSLEASVHQTRLVPLSILFESMPRYVQDFCRASGKQAQIHITGAELELDKRMAEGLRDPLLHLLRNALDHGIEAPEQRLARGKSPKGNLHLRATRERGGIAITLEDDGNGLDLEAVRRTARHKGLEEEHLNEEALVQLLFLPGFSTRRTISETSGRGVGLDVVASQIRQLKGDVKLEHQPGRGCRISLWTPQSLTSTRIVHVEAGKLNLGIPSHAVLHCLRLASGERHQLEGRPVLLDSGSPVVLASLASLLDRPPSPEENLILVLEAGGEKLALGVDQILGEQEVLLKPLPGRLEGLGHYGGVCILGNGQLLLVLEPTHLLNQSRKLWCSPAQTQTIIKEAKTKTRILLADDSLTTRVQLRRILEAAGYQVQLAVDGLDAWSKLGSQPFDALVSDVEMPGLDGVSLVSRLRATPALAQLPAVLITTLAKEEDVRRGLDAGANAYIPKGSFDQEHLLDTLRRLL